jgi:hypothetical protein
MIDEELRELATPSMRFTIGYRVSKGSRSRLGNAPNGDLYRSMQWLCVRIGRGPRGQ